MAKEHLFVYGLFRDSARNLLGDFKHCGRAIVKGKLYKVNEFYPGIRIGEIGDIHGDVYLIDSSEFTSLDEFEGDEYIRTKVRTSTDLDCWIYEFINDIEGYALIRGGDWMLR